MESLICKSKKLIDASKIGILGSVDGSDYPNARAMLKLSSSGLNTFFFSTHSNSGKIKQFEANPKACLYFFDQATYNGLLLTGLVETVVDMRLKEALWSDGLKSYYPLGIRDPGYCILRFVAQAGKYYNSEDDSQVTIEV